MGKPRISYTSRIGQSSCIRSTHALVLIALLLASFLFPLMGCSSNDEEARKDLSSQLNQLIDAEKRGEAELYAQHAIGIELVDDSVIVVIYCKSGQFEAAKKRPAE